MLIASYLIVEAADFMVIVIEARSRPLPHKGLSNVVFTHFLEKITEEETKFDVALEHLHGKEGWWVAEGVTPLLFVSNMSQMLVVQMFNDDIYDGLLLD